MRTTTMAALVMVLGLGGCTVANDINSVTASLSSPAANQAAQNIRTLATAVVCDVSSAAVVYNEVLVEVQAGKAAIRNGNTIYAVSTTICDALNAPVLGKASQLQ